jgi:hypothetical protein
VAVIEYPLPLVLPGTNVVELPVLGLKLPPGTLVDHVGLMLTGLPNWSDPVAVNS